MQESPVKGGGGVEGHGRRVRWFPVGDGNRVRHKRRLGCSRCKVKAGVAWCGFARGGES